jgi:hypothetical protein
MAHCTKDAVVLIKINFYSNNFLIWLILKKIHEKFYSMHCNKYSLITGNNNAFVSAVTDVL